MGKTLLPATARKTLLPPKEKKKKKKGNRKQLLSATARKSVLNIAHVNDGDDSNGNPFDAIWSRRKLHVIGNRKADGLRISRSRSLALPKVSSSLHKSSVFADRRIGEGDDDLSQFDKSVLRLQRQRQKKVKKESKYNLSDDEEDVLGNGIFSREVDDFDEDIPFDEDEEMEPNANSRKENSLHFRKKSGESSLPAVDENKPKSKKQIFEEIMEKSKFHKAVKAKEKDEDEQLLQQLDKDFSSLAQSEALISLTQPTKIKALKALLNRNDKSMFPDESISARKPTENSARKEKPDGYDILIKEMSLEVRARPSDRTKTPEEIAQEEKEHLELLEEERKKRMLATLDSEDESEDDSDDDHKMTPSVTKHVSGDDLGDAIPSDEKLAEKKGWADVILEGKNVDDDSGDGSTSDGSDENGIESNDENGAEDDANADSEMDKDGSNDAEEENEGDDDDGPGSVPENFLSEQSDDDLDLDEDQILEDLCRTDGKNDLNVNSSVVVRDPDFGTCKEKPRKQGGRKLEPIPFVIEAPKNMTELCLLLDSRSDTEIIEAINRIRVCNAVKLSIENRKKMQIFYGILLQYFAVLMGKKPLDLKLINLLVRPLVEMSMDTPYFAAICARERLTRTREQFVEDVKDQGVYRKLCCCKYLSIYLLIHFLKTIYTWFPFLNMIPKICYSFLMTCNAISTEKSSWPSLKTLMLLRLWSLTFPCSDFRHVVMTPAASLMCEYLMRCPLSNCRDTAVGSFLCSMLLSIAKQSCKFFPEALVFLQILFMSAMSVNQGQQHKVSHCYQFLGHRTEKSWLRVRNQGAHVQPPDIFMVMELPVDSSFFDTDDFRVSVLSSAVETLGGFVNVYDGLSSFPEIFFPACSLLRELSKQNSIPGSLRASLGNIAALIKQKSDEHHLRRHPLQMRKQKPVPLKLINPRFEENYEKGRDYDPDRERVERKKLKKLLKKEAKGAARDLRKDNYFLLEAKEKERMALEEERAEKYGEARAFLQDQEHAFKSGQLGKGRKRRR